MPYDVSSMSYALTIGHLHIVPASAASLREYCDCETARAGLSPTYVFSVIGQIEFRMALQHLATCQKKECRSLRVKTVQGMLKKLQWLFEEESLLGCVHVQPYLYGSKKVLLNRKHFSGVATHLAACPKESCAQLRRALLLTVRSTVRPVLIEKIALN